MYHTTGLSREQITDLCAMIHPETTNAERTWPPILGLFTSVVVALTYLRRNRVEVELAETYGVSQPTISRAITTVTPLIEKALMNHVPTADELDDQTLYLIDGTRLPCGSWASHPQLYSGKHQSTGVNVQVAATVYGRLAWILDPVEGRCHDTYCLNTSGVLHTLDPHNWVGDKAYVGYGMDTPIKKPAHRGLLDWEKEFNRQTNKLRCRVERVIANLKTWRILHTDYRRPISTFAETISAVVALHFYATAE